MNPIDGSRAKVHRPSIELAEILRDYRSELGPLPKAHAKVVRDIVQCRTEKLGGHARECTNCGHREQSYNSCRNRHCPKCQFLAKERWVEKRGEELLPVEYFHVVFTIPHELNPLCLRNKAILYNILFKAASDTLKEVGRRRLNAELGFVAILHTWGQNLMDHPHLHFVVPGGGLKKDLMTWVPCKKGYLLPVKILSQIFRAKFLFALEKSHDALIFPGKIRTLARPSEFKRLLRQASEKNWVVYAKKPFAGPEQVIEYLGQYTHRIAISNHRLIKVEDGRVVFQYRDYADHNKSKILSLTVKEFTRRFLLHVLPPKFVRLRHYGFLGNRLRKVKLSACKKILTPNVLPKSQPEQKNDWRTLLLKLTGIDVNRCSQCQGIMCQSALLPRLNHVLLNAQIPNTS
jgi:Putative transposase/Transposase zinc-binding domain